MFAKKGIAALGLSLMLATGIFATPIQKEKATTKTSQPAAKEEKAKPAKEEKAAKPAAKEASSSPTPAHSKKHHRKHHRKHNKDASPTK